ncbi:hypothetical protein [Chlorogloeopsis sp. ULAP02]|uniref:hypothetical protein n=1 Tax=Chlorogloeopsis sp. ULAP02 TaxID=3107926 RepID=UPI0031372494
MTNQQLEEYSQQLEMRVAILEKELAKIKQTLAESLKRKEPWWLKVAGSFENDPTFDETVCLGQEWRKLAK